MSRVDYRGTTGSIVTHYTTNVPTIALTLDDGAHTFDCFYTASVSAAKKNRAAHLTVVFTFMGFVHHEELDETSGNLTRIAQWAMDASCRIADEDVANDFLDEWVSFVEEYSNPPGHGWPPFGEDKVVQAFMSAAVKGRTKDDGGLSMRTTLDLEIEEV